MRWYDNLPPHKQQVFRDFGNMAMGGFAVLLVLNLFQLLRPAALVYILRYSLLGLPLAGLLMALLFTRLASVDEEPVVQEPEEDEE